jgi:WhiB family redox-sensing transcriptional regulator
MSFEQPGSDNVLVWPNRFGFGSGDSIEWDDDAVCQEIDADAHNPEYGTNTPAITSFAKEVCALCTVRPECLKDALESGETNGIRGGLTEGERKILELIQAKKRSRSKEAA